MFIKSKKLIKNSFLQDNHQFSIHQGTVNSMIFEPDLIVTASEKKKLPSDNQLHSRSSIVSEGWLFRNISENQKSLRNFKRKKS